MSIRLQHSLTKARDLGLSANNITLQVQEIHRTEAPNGSWRQSTSIVCEPVIYGRDDKRNEIIEILLKDEPSYDNVVVIPIVGMGGVGKTTLAQYVYNDEQLEGHFDLKAWVCVSDVFDVTCITTDIINSLTKKNHSFSNLNQAQEDLMEVLKGNKFLLVLDDIWSENYNDWNQLQTPFRQGLKGSRVIVTTRKNITVRMVLSNPILSTTIYLKGLSDDDCWCIFQKHTNDDPDFAEMRADIIKKCAGLPLAAKALGGLLKSTFEKWHRQNILESSIWIEKSHILPVLKLSYHHLPSHLKRNFAYCSVLPKGYKFDEMEVVLLWMAQGFVPESNMETMEDIGHNYFFDLVSRSLFEECPSHGGKREFIMHDLIHDLAQWAAGDMCCAMDTVNIQRDLKRTRHLFLNMNGIGDILGNQLLGPQLRTFLCPSYGPLFPVDMNVEILDNVHRFTYIRALRLSLHNIEKLPENIGDLIHLRFLVLHISKMRVLPKSISKLCNLQTLELHSCHNLHELPNVRFMVKLRHLYIESNTSLQEMPLGIERLKCLQTLNNFVLAAGGGSRISELRNLNKLNGYLIISGLEYLTRVKDAQKARLHEKDGLHELYLEWGFGGDEVDDNTKKQVLEHLNPHTSIKVCELNGYRGLTFPTWLGDPSFSNMVNIELVHCKKCESLPSLGQLPLLKNLVIRRMDGIEKIGLEFYGYLGCSVPFPALETLYFNDLKYWGTWLHLPAENNKAFPCLKKLSIKNCSSLQGDFPPLSSLEELEIRNCKKLNTSLPGLPLLQMVAVKECKSFCSNEENFIFCSKGRCAHSILDIFELIGRPFQPYEKVFISNWQSLTTLDELPLFLRQLTVDYCNKLQSVVLYTPFLEKFKVESCQSISAISQIPLYIQRLHIHSCQKLQVVQFSSKEIKEERVAATATTVENVGSLELQLAYLTELRITRCPNLISLQEGLLFPVLEQLYFSDCSNMEGLPSQMYKCTNLQKVLIRKCPRINCFPEGGLPKNLTHLHIEGVNIKQPVQEWELHLLTSLHSLTLYNVGSSIYSVECIPSPNLSLSSSLTTLEIMGFPSLKSICVSSFPNLTKISIQCCPKFESFGHNGLSPQLESVYIYECDLIEQHLESNPEDRMKITLASAYRHPNEGWMF